MTEIQTILVPVDFSAHSEAAVRYAVGLAKRFGSTLHLLHAYHLPVEVTTPDTIAVPRDFWASLREAASSKLGEVARKVTTEGVKVEILLTEGTPAPTITQAAEQLQVDLIVMGTRGLTGLKHVLLGSVAERVLRMAPCPVLTLKDGADT